MLMINLQKSVNLRKLSNQSTQDLEIMALPTRPRVRKSSEMDAGVRMSISASFKVCEFVIINTVALEKYGNNWQKVQLVV